MVYSQMKCIQMKRKEWDRKKKSRRFKVFMEAKC